MPPTSFRLFSSVALLALAGQLLSACTVATPTPSPTTISTLAPPATALPATTTIEVKPPMASPTPLPPTPSALPARAATTLNLHPLQDSVKQFGVLEMNVETDGQPPNPFDTTQWDLRVRFTSPAGNEDATSTDRTGVFLHNALWASAFSGFASTAMYWWWDSYTDPLNLWHHYQGLSDFIKGQDLAALTPSVGFAGSGAEALVLGNKTRALVWLVNHAYSRADAQTAQWGATQTVKVQKGVLTLQVPSLQTDIAVQVAGR
jgi:hypothetical protein